MTRHLLNQGDLMSGQWGEDKDIPAATLKMLPHLANDMAPFTNPSAHELRRGPVGIVTWAWGNDWMVAREWILSDHQFLHCLR